MHSILLLPGDGIGPEVMTETRRVVGWFAQNRNFACTFEEDLVGGISYETHGVPATDARIFSISGDACDCNWDCICGTCEG